MKRRLLTSSCFSTIFIYALSLSLSLSHLYSLILRIAYSSVILPVFFTIRSNLTYTRRDVWFGEEGFRPKVPRDCEKPWRCAVVSSFAFLLYWPANLRHYVNVFLKFHSMMIFHFDYLLFCPRYILYNVVVALSAASCVCVWSSFFFHSSIQAIAAMTRSFLRVSC